MVLSSLLCFISHVTVAFCALKEKRYLMLVQKPVRVLLSHSAFFV